MNFLKKKIIIKLFFYLFFFIILTTTLFLSFTYNKELEYLNKNIEIKNKVINLQIADVQKKEAILVTNLDLWKKISSTNIHNNKYITNLSIMLNELYKEYAILRPEIFISIPQEAKIPYNNMYVKVIKSRINLHFSSVSDRNVFLFINALNMLPGYAIIESFSLVKEKDITPEVIDYAMNGSFIETVIGHIIFDWYSLVKLV